MNAWRHLWLSVWVMGWMLSGCAGGSGSSGFDITENAAINQVLDSGECQDIEGLRICPADTVPIVATSTPTATRTPIMISSQTPTKPSSTPGPEATVTLAPVTPTATSIHVPAPTSTPSGAPPMQVHTTLNEATDVACIPTGTDACRVQFSYMAIGFPPGAVFRTAIREHTAAAWQISEPTDVVDNRPDSNSFQDAVQITGPSADAPAEAGTVQFAVLVFLSDPGTLPATVESLGETHADFAYVLPPVPVAVVAAL